jgi:hypothetical protein
VPATVLIAPPEHLSILHGRAEFGEVHPFADADALKALELIMRIRPQSVVLERTFAGTSRGAALINRIKVDPALAACELRIIAPGGAGGRAAVEPTVDIAAPAPPSPVAPLDQRGTRRAARIRIADGVEVLIDGNPATLVDLSSYGAQVISVAVLKPNQRVRVQLPAATPPLRLTASIAWAAFEIPKSGPRYRAGMAFIEPDADAIRRFSERNAR